MPKYHLKYGIRSQGEVYGPGEVELTKEQADAFGLEEEVEVQPKKELKELSLAELRAAAESRGIEVQGAKGKEPSEADYIKALS
jgi:hypothetical protein